MGKFVMGVVVGLMIGSAAAAFAGGEWVKDKGGWRPSDDCLNAVRQFDQQTDQYLRENADTYGPVR